MENDIRIIYFGTPDFAVEGLKVLIENNYNIVAVVTAPDKPAGRGKKITESAVKKYATKKGLKVLQPTNLKSIEFINEISYLSADLQIVVAFRMLPEIVWNMPKLGTFNLHASLLPQYRGAAPINWAIINGETKTGVTTFFLQHKIDTGNIILQEEIEISETDNAETLHDKLMKLGGSVILKTVKQIESGNINSTPQNNDSELKLAPKIFKSDTKINWCNSTEYVYNFIRGLSPYPASWTKINGKFLKIFETEKDFDTNSTENIITDNNTYLKIKTNDGYISLLSVQLEGKKRIKISDFLRGYNEEINIE